MTAFDIRDFDKDYDFDCNDYLGADKRLEEESVIAFKIYDSCGHRECLDESKTGPAMAAESVCIGDKHIIKGDVIVPPDASANISVNNLRIKKIRIAEKKPNEFRSGFWDIGINYIFEYDLTFCGVDGNAISIIKANSIFKKKLSLFGLFDIDCAIFTDFPRKLPGKRRMLNNEPFVLTEAKATILEALLKPDKVNVVIGLFTVIALFRIVGLTVKSEGLYVSEE